MERGSRIPSGSMGRNTGIPCRPATASIPRPSNIPPGAREIGRPSGLTRPSGVPRPGGIPCPGSRLPGASGMPRPSGVPPGPVFPGVGPMSGIRGAPAPSRMPAPGPISGTYGVPRPGAPTMAGRMPRPTFAPGGGGAPRQEFIPPSSGIRRIEAPCLLVPRAAAAPGPGRIGRPNVSAAGSIPRSGGIPRGAGIPRPGGNVTFSSGMPRPTFSSEVSGTVRPSHTVGVGGVPGTSGIQGTAGIPKPSFSSAGARPCPPRPCVIPGFAGDSTQVSTAAPRQSEFMRPNIPEPCAPPRFNAPGSFLRPPSIQRPGGIPRPGGVPRSGYTTEQCMPRAGAPSYAPGSGINQQMQSVGDGLGPMVPQEPVAAVSQGISMPTPCDTYLPRQPPRSRVGSPCAAYQSRLSPRPPLSIHPQEVHVSPAAGGEMVGGTYMKSGSPITRQAEVTQPCPNIPTVCGSDESSGEIWTPSPLAAPPGECFPEAQRQSPMSRMSSQSPPCSPPPLVRKRRERRSRMTEEYYIRNPPLSSPLFIPDPRDQRIAYKMPCTPVGPSPSPMPMTSPSPPTPPRFFSPTNPWYSDPKSSPCEPVYGPPMMGQDTTSFSPHQPQIQAPATPDRDECPRFSADPAEVTPETVNMDGPYDEFEAMGNDPCNFNQRTVSDDWESSGSPVGVPENYDQDGSDQGYRTPPTARFRRRPSRWRPSKPIAVKRFQDTPLSRAPIKDLACLEGLSERIFPRSHWRKLTDIYEEIGETLVPCPPQPPECPPEELEPCPEEPTIPASQEQQPDVEPPECPPDSWSEEEREFYEEVDPGDGTSTKSTTKIRRVSKEWADPRVRYSTSTKNQETVEILLSPPAGGAAEAVGAGEVVCPADDEGGAEAKCLEDAATADECMRVAEEAARGAEAAAARAREAAAEAGRMAMDAEMAASSCSQTSGLEDEECEEEEVTMKDVEEMRRLLNQEEIEVDMARNFELREYQMRKREFAEGQELREAGGGPSRPCSRARAPPEEEDGPSHDVLAAMMWAEECGVPLSSDPENLFQVLFGSAGTQQGDECLAVESTVEDQVLAGPERYSRVQLRGSSVPPWFSGYHCAFPVCVDIEGRRNGVMVAAKSPSKVLYSAWLTMSPESFVPAC